MADIVTALLTNSQTLLVIILFYLAALWLMFCLWVFIDAMKRFRSLPISIILTLLTFVFNFPALVFYLIIRPEDPTLDGYASEGGVNVPLMNFVGNDGEVQFSLNLKVNPKYQPGADMDVNVNWKSERADVRPVESTYNLSASVSEPVSSGSSIKDKLAGFRSKATSSFKQVVETSKKKVDDYSQEISSTDEGGEEDDKAARSAKSKRK